MPSAHLARSARPVRPAGPVRAVWWGFAFAGAVSGLACAGGSAGPTPADDGGATATGVCALPDGTRYAVGEPAVSYGSNGYCAICQSDGGFTSGSTALCDGLPSFVATGACAPDLPECPYRGVSPGAACQRGSVGLRCQAGRVEYVCTPHGAGSDAGWPNCPP